MSVESNNNQTFFKLMSDDGRGGHILVANLITKVRDVAGERNIDLPKKIGCGGKFGDYVYVSHKKKIVRELVLEISNEFDGLELM